MKQSILTIIFFLLSFNIYSYDFVEVKGGTFTRHVYYYGDKQQYFTQKIKLSSFMIANTEVSIKEYNDFIKSTKKEISEKMVDFSNTHDISDYPAFEVCFYDAIKYCNWLSEKEGLEKCYTITERKDKPNNIDWNRIPKSASWKHFPEVIWNRKANGYRLPTEAEWEYAATAGGKDKYILSDKLELLGEYGKIFKNHRSLEVLPLMKYKPNQLKIYDLIGSVGEWCFDYLDINYYKNNKKLNNPSGPEIGNDIYDDFNYFPMYNRVYKTTRYLYEKDFPINAIYSVYGENPLNNKCAIRLVRNK